jgi:hypothetical protein
LPVVTGWRTSSFSMKPRRRPLLANTSELAPWSTGLSSWMSGASEATTTM